MKVKRPFEYAWRQNKDYMGGARSTTCQWQGAGKIISKHCDVVTYLVLMSTSINIASLTYLVNCLLIPQTQGQLFSSLKECYSCDIPSLLNSFVNEHDYKEIEQKVVHYGFLTPVDVGYIFNSRKANNKKVQKVKRDCSTPTYEKEHFKMWLLLLIIVCEKRKQIFFINFVVQNV